MAHFNIENSAGKGMYVPYAYSTLYDMTGATGGTLFATNNVNAAAYHLHTTNLDVATSFTYQGGTSATVHDMEFYFNGSLNMVAEIRGLGLYVDTSGGLTAMNQVLNSGHDTFEGNDFGDLIHGGVGNDLIVGYGGNDVLYGDLGDDTIDGGPGTDRIDGGLGFDTVIYGGRSSDYQILPVSDGNAGLMDKYGNVDSLVGIEAFQFDDGVFNFGQLASQPIYQPLPPVVQPPPPVYQPPAPEPPRVIEGTAGADMLHGNGLDNVIKGHEGRDTMWGHGGRDAFVFDTSPKGGRDKILDFNVRADTIKLDNADFTKVGGNGKLKADAFYANTTGKAHDASDRVIYDKDSGKLYYDSDGTGAKAGVCFSDISKNLKLTAADFFVL